MKRQPAVSDLSADSGRSEAFERVRSPGVWDDEWDLTTPPLPDPTALLVVYSCGQRSTLPLEGLRGRVRQAGRTLSTVSAGEGPSRCRLRPKLSVPVLQGLEVPWVLEVV